MIFFIKPALYRTSLMLSSTLVIALSCAPLMADEGHDAHHDHETRESHSPGNHEAHVHGIAKLLVVLEGSQLDMELRSPAINLLGFEHRATTKKQGAQIENTRRLLANAKTLFSFSGGNCTLNQQSEDFTSVLATEEERHTEQDSPLHSDHTPEHRKHSDIVSAYQYRCVKPDTLNSMAIHLYTPFPGIESLQVQWIIHGRQGATTLNNKHNDIHFR